MLEDLNVTDGAEIDWCSGRGVPVAIQKFLDRFCRTAIVHRHYDGERRLGDTFRAGACSSRRTSAPSSSRSLCAGVMEPTLAQFHTGAHLSAGKLVTSSAIA